jgi:hypothetical protein
MERPFIKDEAMEAKIREALVFVEKNHPEEREFIDRKLKHIVLVGGEPYEGDIIIHDYERESIIGEYYIHVDSARNFSISDIADRLSLAALLIENKKGIRIDDSWISPGKEIEDLMASTGRLCCV